MKNVSVSSVTRIVFFVSSVFIALSSYAATLTGRVVRVADGDTIAILEGRTQHKIRLAGIDAPEKKQAYGHASRKRLASLIASQTVTVEWNKVDKYGRKVGKILYNG